MNVTLAPPLSDFVRSKIEAGDYESENALINESVRQLAQRETAWKTYVSQAIDEGLEDIQAGRVYSAEESQSKMADFKVEWRKR